MFYTESINRIIFQFHFEYNTCAYSFFYFFFTCVTNPSSKHWTYKIYTIYSFTVISLFCSIACGIVIWQLPFSCCHQSFRLKYHSNLLNFFFISILEHRFRRTYLRTFMSYMLWCSFFSFFSSKQQHWHQKTIRAHTEFIRKIENYSNLWVFQWNTCMCICKMFRLFIISVHMVQSWHQCCYCYLSIYSEILSLSSTAFSFKVFFCCCCWYYIYVVPWKTERWTPNLLCALRLNNPDRVEWHNDYSTSLRWTLKNCFFFFNRLSFYYFVFHFSREREMEREEAEEKV